MHEGHLFVATQQPLLPGLEPSAHVAAEAQAAAKTSTRNAVRLGAIDRRSVMIQRDKHKFGVEELQQCEG